MAVSLLLKALPFEPCIVNLSFATIVIFSISYIFYRSYLDSLSSVPGPLICRLTSLWDWYHGYKADQSTAIQALHDKYGPVVRITPYDVVIADGEALAPIYSLKGGFLKAPCYINFDFDGHPTIFSALSPQHRAIRSKAVMPMFSTANIRARIDVIEHCVASAVQRLKQEAVESRGTASPVNVLNVSRSLAIDTVTSYLFGEDYGGTKEQASKLSASEYVDSVVAFGRFFYLPNWLFVRLFTWWEQTHPEEQAGSSAEKVSNFTKPLVDKSPKDDSTYQSRLLKAGITTEETDIQMKDVIFAGTDTTGTNMSNILWQLAKHPEVYRQLRKEIAQAETEDPNYNPSTLPYLDAVIREGLRTSMANPTRLPRQVPPEGWTYTASDGQTYHFPGGTIVGMQQYTLHFNPKVFTDPRKFKPERWMESPTPEMYRDAIPFGLGSRQCIARNLAQVELVYAVRVIAKSNVLEGARPVKDKIEMLEWFNAKVVGERIDLVWE